MHLQPEFIPHTGTYSWQVSTPCIMSMAPLAASLEIIAEIGIDPLRKKSELQTAFLLALLEEVPSRLFEIVSPKEPCNRGAQISLLIHTNAESCVRALNEKQIVCDFRPPNILRVTPSPLYTTFHDIYTFVRCLNEILIGH